MSVAEAAIDDIIFMIKADEAGREAACAAARAGLPADVSGRFRPENVIHASLVLAGPANDPRVEPGAREIAGLVRAARFELVFDTLVGFGGPKGVLALTCSAIPPQWAPLRNQVSQAPRRLGRRVEGGATPHLTVGYGFAATAPMRLSAPVVWTVDEFLLVRSFKGEARHEDLARWGLQ